MLMTSGKDSALEDREIRALQDQRVDGRIYAAEYHRVVPMPAALSESFTVLVDARTADKRIPSVVPDEEGGAVSAVNELAAHGHKRIGFVNNQDGIPGTHGRLKGYRRGLRDNGLRFRGELVVYDHSGPGGGYAGASTLLDLRNRPLRCSAATTAWRWAATTRPPSEVCGYRTTYRSSDSTTRTSLSMAYAPDSRPSNCRITTWAAGPSLSC